MQFFLGAERMMLQPQQPLTSLVALFSLCLPQILKEQPALTENNIYPRGRAPTSRKPGQEAGPSPAHSKCLCATPNSSLFSKTACKVREYRASVCQPPQSHLTMSTCRVPLYLAPKFRNISNSRLSESQGETQQLAQF